MSISIALQAWRVRQAGRPLSRMTHVADNNSVHTPGHSGVTQHCLQCILIPGSMSGTTTIAGTFQHYPSSIATRSFISSSHDSDLPFLSAHCEISMCPAPSKTLILKVETAVIVETIKYFHSTLQMPESQNHTLNSPAKTVNLATPVSRPPLITGLSLGTR